MLGAAGAFFFGPTIVLATAGLNPAGPTFLRVCVANGRRSDYTILCAPSGTRISQALTGQGVAPILYKYKGYPLSSSHARITGWIYR